MAPFPLVLKYCPFNPTPIISLYTLTPIQFHLQGRTTKRLLATTNVLSAVVTEDSLGVLQWDQLCHSVASFAGTSIAAQATKEQLWELDKTYDDSLRLLRETNAAVEMNKYGAMMDFTAINVSLVKTGLQCAQRGFPVSATEAVALVNLLQFAEALQSNVKAAIKEDSDWFNKFMPLSELIMELMISRSLIKLIGQLVDEDGSVRDSASSNLRQAREQVRFLERKLYQLMESMIRNESKETSTMEISNVDGRWCIQSGGDTRPTFDGLLLSSGAGNLVEPLPAVPINDELQRARASVAKAEADVLLKITKKIQEDFDDIEDLFNILIQIDTINARARYSISFEGSCPDLYLPQGYDSTLNAEIMPECRVSETSQLTRKKWALYLPKSYHPLLLQQYRSNLQTAMKDLSNANAEIRRRKQLGGTGKWKDEANLNIPSLEMQVARLKQARPTPFDIFIEEQTKVLVVTGPNTGGKTIFLKTVGLAAMMAKSGLYVLASEPARIPWFDFVLADIGDEQSLSQSLSTFSGHLKQISDIKSLSTNLSLVLLDEVGAGTNPLEGAALGMSLLESFADAGSLLTVATTHHGELKTLKYSNAGFENACMEFDEVNLKPTYRILWGVPGRSNAINVAERLGLPSEIVGNARELYGAASTEINEVIVDMERFKHEYHEKIHEARHYLRRSKDLHRKLTLARKRIMEHRIKQRNRMVQEVSEAAVSARSIIHKKFRQQRSLPAQTTPQRVKVDNYTHRMTSDHYSETVKKNESSPAAEIAKSPDSTELLRTGELNFNRNESSSAAEITKSPDSTELLRTEKKLELPKVGDMVNVPSLKMKATVLKLDPVKEEIIVQSGFMKLKLKLGDLVN